MVLWGLTKENFVPVFNFWMSGHLKELKLISSVPTASASLKSNFSEVNPQLLFFSTHCFSVDQYGDRSVSSNILGGGTSDPDIGHLGGLRDIRQGPEKWAGKKNNKERRTQKTATRGYRRKEQEIR